MKNIKITFNDILNNITQNKIYKFCNGFFLKDGKLISRETLRKELSLRYSISNIQNINKMEDAIVELNSIDDEVDIRHLFLTSYEKEKTQGKPKIIKSLESLYPNYDWNAILTAIFVHRSDYIFILYGQSLTGKSTLLEVIKAFYGDFNISLTIEQMSNRFNLGEIQGKLMVVGDDLGTESFGNTIGLIKSMITSNSISLERKFQQSFKIKPITNFCYACNKLPILDLADDGILRRVIILNFDKKIENPDKNFITEITTPEEVQKLYNYLQKDQNFEYLDKLNKDSIVQLIDNSSVGLSKKYNYKEYVSFCKENGYKNFNSGNFEFLLAKLKEIEGMERVDMPLPF